MLVVKKLPASARKHKRHGFNPWVEKIPWRRARQPTPTFLSGERRGIAVMDRGTWWATIHRVAKSWTWLKTTEHTVKAIRTHPLKILLRDITPINTECKSNVISKHALMESHKVRKEWNLHQGYLVLTRFSWSQHILSKPSKNNVLSYARLRQTLCNTPLKSVFYFLSL